MRSEVSASSLAPALSGVATASSNSPSASALVRMGWSLNLSRWMAGCLAVLAGYCLLATYYPRYGVPFIPLLLLLVAMIAHALVQRLRTANTALLLTTPARPSP